MTILGVAASSGGGIYAVATAVGGVAVSIFTVYKNAQKQAQFTGENTGHIQSLSEQIGLLNAQIIELKAQNAGLSTELRLVKEAHEADRRRPRDDEDDYEAPNHGHRYEDDEDDYEPPRRKRPSTSNPSRKKKK